MYQEFIDAMDSYIETRFENLVWLQGYAVERQAKNKVVTYSFSRQGEHIGKVSVMPTSQLYIKWWKTGMTIPINEYEQVLPWLKSNAPGAFYNLWFYIHNYLTLEVFPLSQNDETTGGRPSNKLYDWAYQEIENGRDQNEVYREWLEKLPNERRLELADPQESFKKAISYRRKREKRE